jgi:hypothetical protein
MHSRTSSNRCAARVDANGPKSALVLVAALTPFKEALVRSLVPIVAAAIALVACTDTYHPEYHPVTVTNFSQNVGYPVVVNNGGASPSPVVVAPMSNGSPSPAPAFVAQPPPTSPPPDFFEHP